MFTMHTSLFVIVWLSLGYMWLSTSAESKKVSLRGYDPGKCNKGNHGKLVMIKNREDNDKLLVCAEENNVYLWKATDGSNPTGEYFNPAYDCSDALNKISEAKDGFYWIKLSGNVPKKAYCDMSTDGGGWVLIGRKTNPVTWTVPSNNKTVEPFGKPHWSSSLGEAPIVDFRVQVATQENFSATKAHWSFRLKNKRPLKNLLMLNEGGCGRLWPGIGDISYVKDLQTEEIITTKFRCSQFSSYHSKSDGFGWDMLNNCLNSPCSSGFAFHKKYPVQIDFSGAFSYSASANTSGITYDSTSFVGCENRKCCGCFGPVGGKKNYCGTECRAKNGGTVVKNVYTWFWVRSSLPKRVWNKCMEYQVTVGQGKMVWYKLYNGNAVPVMGRCGQKEALLNDGIVVVPDSAAAQKVPPVPGLLEYRKDTKKLYVRSNETWNVIGEEKKLNIEFAKLEKNLAEVKTQLGSVNKTVNEHIKINDGLYRSAILSQQQNYIVQLEKWLGGVKSWKLCYRATDNGWLGSTFHKLCDSKKPIVTIIRSRSYIFGAYSDVAFRGSSGYRRSYNAFIFSFVNKDNLPPFKSPVYRYSEYALYTHSSYGPTFGGGHDIYISNNANANTGSYTNLGYTYRPPSGYSYSSTKVQNLLAGTYKFTPNEVETFYFN